jgi:hypothetical protein
MIVYDASYLCIVRIGLRYNTEKSVVTENIAVLINAVIETFVDIEFIEPFGAGYGKDSGCRFLIIRIELIQVIKLSKLGKLCQLRLILIDFLLIFVNLSLQFFIFFAEFLDVAEELQLIIYILADIIGRPSEEAR